MKVRIYLYILYSTKCVLYSVNLFKRTLGAFVFNLKMCFCLNKMFPYFIKTYGNTSRLIAYPDWKSFVGKCERVGLRSKRLTCEQDLTNKISISKISKPASYNTNTIESDVKQIKLSCFCFIPTYLNNLLVKQVVKTPNIV